MSKLNNKALSVIVLVRP